MNKSRIKFATKAFGVHLLGSILLAIFVAILVFGLWFPSPLGSLAGGMSLMGILVAVDLICGPLLTAILSNPKKGRKEQWCDWALVVVIQLGALIYGLSSIALARPVAIAFEVDRFVAVAAADVDKPSLGKADGAFKALSWTGPIWVGVREPRDSDERLNSIEMSINGIEPSARPDWWEALEKSRGKIQQRARPLALVIPTLDSGSREAVLRAADAAKLAPEELNFLPLVSYGKLDSWVVLLDKHGQVVGYAPIGGFRE